MPDTTFYDEHRNGCLVDPPALHEVRADDLVHLTTDGDFRTSVSTMAALRGAWDTTTTTSPRPRVGVLPQTRRGIFASVSSSRGVCTSATVGPTWSASGTNFSISKP